MDRESDTLVGRTSFTRKTGGGPQYFDVTIDNTNSPVVEGETLIVRPTIENVGGESGTQTIELLVEGNLTDTQSLSLHSGEWNQIELEGDMASGNSGDYDVTVQNVNDSDSRSVRVNNLALTPFFDVL